MLFWKQIIPMQVLPFEKIHQFFDEILMLFVIYKIPVDIRPLLLATGLCTQEKNSTCLQIHPPPLPIFFLQFITTQGFILTTNYGSFWALAGLWHWQKTFERRNKLYYCQYCINFKPRGNKSKELIHLYIFTFKTAAKMSTNWNRQYSKVKIWKFKLQSQHNRNLSFESVVNRICMTEKNQYSLLPKYIK